MMFLTWINVEKFLFNGDDKNTVQHAPVDIDFKTLVNYNETNLFNFFTIRHQNQGDKPIYINDTKEKMEDYIDISFR